MKSSPLIWRLLSKCQIDGEDFIIFCGLLRKHELYLVNVKLAVKISSFFVAFLENMNFTYLTWIWLWNIILGGLYKIMQIFA